MPLTVINVTWSNLNRNFRTQESGWIQNEFVYISISDLCATVRSMAFWIGYKITNSSTSDFIKYQINVSRNIYLYELRTRTNRKNSKSRSVVPCASAYSHIGLINSIHFCINKQLIPNKQSTNATADTSTNVITEVSSQSSIFQHEIKR